MPFRHWLQTVLIVLLVGVLACGSSMTAPSSEQPAFTDVTSAVGIHFVHRELPDRMMPIGAGVVVLDFDGDGRDDIYFPNTNGTNHLYRNRGDGAFEEVAVRAGVDDPEGEGNGGCACDYDNDGDVDLFVTNFGPSRLFQNRGEGTFDDVTAAAGLDEGARILRSTGCAWGDYDGDGYPDLVVTRHLNEFNPDLLMKKDFYSSVGGLALFRNVDGAGFVDVTALLGGPPAPVEGRDVHLGNVWGAGFQPSWLDYDDDGDVDLLVINDFGADIHPNVLWRNDGGDNLPEWKFTDVSLDTGVDVPMYGMGLAVGDPNADGLVDLFVTNIKNNVLFSREVNVPAFADIAREARTQVGNVGGLLRVAWGAVFFDYDNDMDEDLYVVSGYLSGDSDVVPANPTAQPNVLLRNGGAGTFEDVSEGSGANDPGVGRGGAYLDYDGDGCLDVVVANFDQPARMFKNTCAEGNHWLRVHLQGGASGADGLGARVEVRVGGKTQVRRTVSGTSFMSQNMLDSHFGLGGANTAESVTVSWPSGKVQQLTDVPTDRVVTIVEP